MTNLSRAITLLAISFLFFGSAHAEQLSCDELADAGGLIDQLELIATYEDNDALAGQIAIMADEWEQMDGEKLMSGLNGVITGLDTLLSNDC